MVWRLMFNSFINGLYDEIDYLSVYYRGWISYQSRASVQRLLKKPQEWVQEERVWSFSRVRNNSTHWKLRWKGSIHLESTWRVQWSYSEVKHEPKACFHHKTSQTTNWDLVGRLQQISQRRYSITGNEISWKSMSTFWSPQFRSDREKKGGVQNVRFSWEMESSETWPTRLGELPMSAQMKMTALTSQQRVEGYLLLGSGRSHSVHWIWLA